MVSQISGILASGMRFVMGSRKAIVIGVALALCAAALLIPGLGPVFVGLAVLLLLTVVAAMGGRVVQERCRVAELEAELTTVSSRNTRAVGSTDANKHSDLDTAKREILESAEQLSSHLGSGVVVTVIVPCFNDSSFLPMTLESLQRQWLQDWRCIVVDDGSTDSTSDVIAAFSESDDRISGIQHPENRGLSAARNTGLKATTTEFVCFLDADDFLTPASLADRAITLAHAEDSSIAGSYCGIVMVSEDATLDSVAPLKIWSNPGIHDFVSTGGDCPFNCHAPMLRTKVVAELGGFDETMRAGGEDWDLWLRLMRNGYYFIPSRFFGGAYRQRRSSMVRTDAKRHLEVSKQLLESAYEPLAGASKVNQSSAYDLPANVYQLKLALAKRSLAFAGITAVSASVAEARLIVATIDESTLSLANRHFSQRLLLGSGVARGLGLIEPLQPDESQRVAAIVDEILG